MVVPMPSRPPLPVETAFGCDYYTSGTLTYELELLDNVPAVLDFGDGSCDKPGYVDDRGV